MAVEGLEHVAIAVDDIQKAATIFRDQLGLPLEDIRESSAFNMKLAFVTQEGQRRLELIEMVGDSPLSAFVPQKKPALHHVALKVKDIEETMKELRAQGMQPVDEEPRTVTGGTRLAFINPATSGGIMLELVERPE